MCCLKRLSCLQSCRLLSHYMPVLWSPLLSGITLPISYYLSCCLFTCPGISLPVLLSLYLSWYLITCPVVSLPVLVSHYLSWYLSSQTQTLVKGILDRANLLLNLTIVQPPAEEPESSVSKDDNTMWKQPVPTLGRSVSLPPISMDVCVR